MGINGLDLDGLRKKGISFCTDCETDLENFCFSFEINNLDVLKKKVEHCRLNGRLDGTFCAKLFIASSYTLDSMWLEDE